MDTTPSFMESTADCKRVIYTASDFARKYLLHLQEAGQLSATDCHTGHRSDLRSFLLIIVRKGSGSVEYNGKLYNLKQGDCAFIDCMKAYTHKTSDDPWSLSWVHFYGEAMPSIYEKYFSGDELCLFTPKSMLMLQHIIDEICILAKTADNTNELKINEKLSALIAIIAEETASFSGHKKPEGKWNSQLFEIKEYLDENYEKHISLEELSSKFFMNKFTMIRYFGDNFGISPLAYLQSVRITKAKEFLRFTGISIEEIAWKCGFPDGNYFSRIFKKIEKITPGEYRKRWLSSGEDR